MERPGSASEMNVECSFLQVTSQPTTTYVTKDYLAKNSGCAIHSCCVALVHHSPPLSERRSACARCCIDREWVVFADLLQAGVLIFTEFSL